MLPMSDILCGLENHRACYIALCFWVAILIWAATSLRPRRQTDRETSGKDPPNLVAAIPRGNVIRRFRGIDFLAEVVMSVHPI